LSERTNILNGVPIPYGSTVAELTLLLSRGDSLGWAAFAALAQKGCPDSLQVLQVAAEDSDWHVRRCAIEALGQHALARLAEQTIIRSLSEAIPGLVRAACSAVACAKLAGAHRAIVGLLTDTNPMIREMAIRTLSEIWQPADFAAVWIMHISDPEIAVRQTAAWLLFKYAASDSWRPLFDQWAIDPRPRHRKWACDLASQFGDSTLADALRHLENDQDGHVRKAASRVLSSWESQVSGKEMCEVVKRITGLEFCVGGEPHSGWLPPGAAMPRPTVERVLVFDLEIQSDGSGYLFCYLSRDQSMQGDTWHETLLQAETAAFEQFGVQVSKWQDAA
jgi:HEAT repeat protein